MYTLFFFKNKQGRTPFISTKKSTSPPTSTIEDFVNLLPPSTKRSLKAALSCYQPAQIQKQQQQQEKQHILSTTTTPFRLYWKHDLQLSMDYMIVKWGKIDGEDERLETEAVTVGTIDLECKECCVIL